MKNKALLGFSIGQDSSKEEILKQDLTLASKKYDSFTILAADTLQRHTRAMLKIELSESDAYNDALEQGNKWLITAKAIADELGAPYEILRWDDVRKLEGFENKLKEVNNLYSNNKVFHKAVKQTIGKFLTRYQKSGLLKNNKETMQACFNPCLQYVLEECAAVWLLGSSEFGYTHLQYHYKLGDAISYICKLIQEINPELMRPVVASDLNKNPAISFMFKGSDPVNIVDPYQFAIKQQVDSFLLLVDALIMNNQYPEYYKREALKSMDLGIREKLAKSFSQAQVEQRNSL